MPRIYARMALGIAILPRASGTAERAKVKMWLDAAWNRSLLPPLGLKFSRRVR